MSHIVDTDLGIDWLGGTAAARLLLDPLMPNDLGISVISLMEILEGLPGSQDTVTARFGSMIEFMPVHPVTQETAGIAATIRRQL